MKAYVPLKPEPSSTNQTIDDCDDCYKPKTEKVSEEFTLIEGPRGFKGDKGEKGDDGVTLQPGPGFVVVGLEIRHSFSTVTRG